MKLKPLFLSAILSVSLTGCFVNWHNVLGEYTYKNSSSYTQYLEEKSLIIYDEDWSGLLIDWIAGEIEIKEGGSEFVIKEKYISGNYKPLYYRSERTTLDIKYCQNGTSNKDLDGLMKKLEITVPTNLDLININIVSGSLKIKAGFIEEFYVSSVSGNSDIELQSVKRIYMDRTSGSVSLKIIDTTKVEKINLESVSGDSNLYLDERRGYDLDFDSVSGSSNKEFEEGTDTSLSKYSVNVSSVTGNLNIHKA